MVKATTRVDWLVSRMALILLFNLVITACGRKESHSSGGSAYQLPDYLAEPSEFSPVPIGSRKVVAFPPAGSVRGTLLLRLASEPGAMIYYDFRDPGADPDVLSMKEAKGVLHLLPPVSIWAVAVVNDVAGAAHRFDYHLSSELFDPTNLFEMTRLPSKDFKFISISNRVDFTRYDADADATRNPLKSVPDGSLAGWSGSGRYFLTDGLYDVPEHLGAIDVSYAQVHLSQDRLEFVLALREKPSTGEGRSYGFDIGDSGISFASFGKGTKFIYRVESTKGALVVSDRVTSQELPVSSSSKSVSGDVVEFSLALSDLPQLSGLKNMVIRPFAFDINEGLMVMDRIEPFIFQTEFAVDRTSITRGKFRSWDINFLMDPEISPESLSGKYLAMSGPMIDDLEKMNQIPFYSRGSLQLFFVDKEENGYAGLNTSDRGMLTTLGPQTSMLSKAQLLVHEFAHYQNARNAGILDRWIQEGMSEWSAERYLYRHFPRRAVYKFMRRLRYDRYFESTAGKADSFPLVTWKAGTTSIGYEKSLMFTNLLEKVIGHKNLLKLYQIGVNETMDTNTLKRYAEHLSGKDLTNVFNFWAYDGPVDPSYSPAALFKDVDDDGLMGFDEQSLGTDPVRADTDSDGYPDGEEYFRGMDPNISFIDPKGELTGTLAAMLVNAADTDTMALMRIGGERGADFNWSFVPNVTSPEHAYSRPEFFRPPYTISIQATKGGASGVVRTLERSLYVGGIKQNLSYASEHILPAQPRSTKDLSSDITRSADAVRSLNDNPNDLPEFIGSMDITGVSVVEDADHFIFTVKTRSHPDPYGQYGDIVFSFDEINWLASGPTNTRINALTLSAGAPFWHKVSDNVETAALIDDGVETAYSTDLKVRVAKSLLGTWLSSAGERLVCIQSNIEIELDNKMRDRAGCLVFTHPGFSSELAATDDAFGLTRHQLQIFWTTAAATPSRFENAAKIGLSALNAFEEILQRPIFDRSYWPIHLRFMPNQQVYGSATQKSGAWLSVPLSYEQDDGGYNLDYLIVEQLARQVMTDLLERGVSTPFWMQEVFIQWLTSSAMYKIYPTGAVHAFHRARIDEYKGFIDNGPPGPCSGVSGKPPSPYIVDIDLIDWNIDTNCSAGSVKSLVLALYLDSYLGADVMSKAFGSWFNRIPSSEGIKAILAGYAADEKVWIESVFASWVDGTGNAAADTAAVRVLLNDDDGDGLYLFQEQKLGTSDAIFNSYLND